MPETCPCCESGYVSVEAHTFFWHGVASKVSEVAWCRTCDYVWVIPVAEILPAPEPVTAEAA